MSTRDITNHIEEIYGVQMSATGISNITNRILEEVKLWQKRPLSDTYAVMFLDGMIFKDRDNNSVVNKTVYVLISINMEGLKEVVGIYVAEAETSKYWLTVLTDIKERGVQKILIFCTDNLKGLDKAITAAYPQSDHPKCIEHQIRNSVKHICHKDMKAVCVDLKAVYTAKDEASGKANLTALSNVGAVSMNTSANSGRRTGQNYRLSGIILQNCVDLFIRQICLKVSIGQSVNLPKPRGYFRMKIVC